MTQSNYEIMKQKLISTDENGAVEWIKETFDKFARLMTYYRCAMMEIETKFNVLNEEYSLAHDRNPISSIKTRLKSFPSIREKLVRKGLEESVSAIEENLNDVAGVRVICPFPEDVYVLANALLKQDDVFLIEKKDYIKKSKTKRLSQSSYDSCHTYFPCSRKANDEGGNSTSYHSNGLLGKFGASTPL